MRVFISWSGERSNRIAQMLHRWMPQVIQRLQPYISSADIAKGARWSQDLGSQLEGINFGIACLVPENLEASWIQFEAGALSKSLTKGLVAPILFGVEQSQLAENPLVQFQCTEFSKEDMLKLMDSINRSEGPGQAIPKELLEKAFAQNWPELERKVNAEIATAPSTRKMDPAQAIQQKVFEELTGLAREQMKSLQKVSAKISSLMPTDVQPKDLITNYGFASALSEFGRLAKGILNNLENAPVQLGDVSYAEFLIAKLDKLKRSIDRLEAAAATVQSGGGTIASLRTALVDMRRAIAVLEAP